jgi:ketosteroid isomerase-like protein
MASMPRERTRRRGQFAPSSTITAMDPKSTVAELWRRLQARDWDGLAELLAEDLVIEWPNTRQRIRRRDAYVEFNRAYPEGWTIEVINLIAEGATVVSEVRVPHTELGRFDLVSILVVEDGRVVRGREYWMDEVAEDIPPERARWLESM